MALAKTLTLGIVFVCVSFKQISSATVSSVECSENENCTVTNSACNGTKCQCDDGYKEDTNDGSTCVKVLGGSCSTDTDCTDKDINSECDTICKCVAGYYEVLDICTAVIGSKCTTDSNCTARHANTVCNTTSDPAVCACATGYYTDTVECKAIFKSECTANATCTDRHSTGYFCDTSADPKICDCTNDFVVENDVCYKAHGTTCDNVSECVSNAECDTTCKCESDYMPVNGLCIKNGAGFVKMTGGLVALSLLLYLF